MDTHKHIWPIEKRGCFYGESDICYTSSDTIVSRYKQHQAFFPSTNIHYWPSVRSGWLDIDHILLCNFSAQDKVEVYKNRTRVGGVVPGVGGLSVVSLYISCMGWVGEWDQIWTDSGSQRRLYKLTFDLTQLEL